MIVKCIARTRETAKGEIPTISGDNTGRYPVVVGTEYVVHAVVFEGKVTQYLIESSMGLHTPLLFPAGLFEVVDTRLPSFWHLGYFPAFSSNEDLTLATFPELARDPSFLDRLIDREEPELSTFLEYVARGNDEDRGKLNR